MPYTLQQFTDDLCKIPPDSQFPGDKVERMSLSFCSNGTPNWCAINNPSQPFEALRICKNEATVTLVKEIIEEVKTAAQANPNALVIKYNFFDGELLISALELQPITREEGRPKDFIDRKRECLKRVLDESSSSYKNPAEMAEILQKAEIYGGTFVRIEKKWYLGAPWDYNHNMNRWPYSKGHDPLIKVESNNTWSHHLFICKKIDRFNFYICTVTLGVYDKVYPVIQKPAEPNFKNLLDGILKSAPTIDEDGIETTIQTIDDGTTILGEMTIRKLDGKRHGLTVCRDKDGNLSYTAEYANDMINGKWIDFHPNGQKESEHTYRNDVPDGPFTVWDRFGKLIEEGEYVNGRKQLKSALVPVENSKRSMMTMNDRILIFETLAGKNILIGALDVGNGGLVTDEKLPKPTSADCEVARKAGYFCLNAY